MSHDNNPSDLEYNDGVGDLLKERVRPPFNWIKFGLVMCGGIVIVLVSVVGFFKLGAFVFHKQTTHVTAAKELAAIERELAPAKPLPVPPVTPVKAPVAQQVQVTKPSAVKALPKKVVHPSVKKTVTPVLSATPPVLSYKVIAGSFSSQRDARSFMATLTARGLRAFVWARVGTPSSSLNF